MNQCTLCVMDTSDPDISFDGDGVCNWCREAQAELPRYTFTPEQAQANLARIADEIRSRRRGDYDCVLGLSGGVDSSYVAYLAASLGLKALCVHFDNGWNSERAVANIQKIIEVCKFDLFTYVIDWEEFKDIQRSFFKASVIDVELISDHAIFASMIRIAREHRIGSVLSGANYRTEHGLPPSWVWLKSDLRNLKAIQRRFGNRKLKSFPTMGVAEYAAARLFGIGGRIYRILDHMTFSKTEAMQLLEREFGWQYYGGKHYESRFTKFYQACYLPEKFGVDKRKSHLSCQIRIGEISRDDAVAELAHSPYDPQDRENDYEFVIKKLNFSRAEFDAIMHAPPVPHDAYPSSMPLFRLGKRLAGHLPR